MAFRILVFAASIVAAVSQMNQCASNNRSCGECISVSGCAWCFQEVFVENRCQPADGNISLACDSVNIADPSSSVKTLVSNEASNPISLSRADLSLRVGDPVSFEVSVTPQRNLPLDLYILIDLSGSMGDELQTVQRVSSQIVENIRGITDNVRIGLGAFNDKLARPYFSVPDANVCDPAASTGRCATFSVRNVISLTDNTTQFASAVNRATVTENDDAPENGLEGLAQVIACEHIIGWRNASDGSISKVILFMTDNTFHYAGEGRLGGIVRPYDGQCLLQYNQNSGFYEYLQFDRYDYPSIGQVVSQVENSDVFVIFAVAPSPFDTYQNLAELLNTVSRRATVDRFDASGDQSTSEDAILNLINQEYARLLQEVSLSIGDGAGDLDITLTPMCPNTSTPTGSRACSGVSFETAVPYNVTVTLKMCNPSDNGQVREQKINSPSFGSFSIRYTIICNCECAEQSFFDPNQCSGMGNRSCSVCECKPGICGQNCDRELDDRASTDCPRGGINQEVCSGNGICDCGCRCNPVEEGTISGDACQCNDFQCLDSRDSAGRTCHGNGLCCSGNCACYYVNATTNQRINNDPLVVYDPNDRYRGEGGLEYCQCDSVNRACRQFPGAPVCNGNGRCGCNFCMCDSMYKGFFCDLPANDSCGFPMDIECILECREGVNNEENIPDMCSCNPTRPVLYINNFEIEMLDGVQMRQYYETVANIRLRQSSAGSSFGLKTDGCTAVDKDNCEVDYVIVGNDTHCVIVAVRQRMCNQAGAFRLAIPSWALALILLGCLLLIGIFILVLIKIILKILDFLELKRWEREAKEADFSKNQNPLYQSPEMKYENVAYGRE